MIRSLFLAVALYLIPMVTVASAQEAAVLSPEQNSAETQSTAAPQQAGQQAPAEQAPVSDDPPYLMPGSVIGAYGVSKGLPTQKGVNFYGVSPNNFMYRKREAGRISIYPPDVICEELPTQEEIDACLAEREGLPPEGEIPPEEEEEAALSEEEELLKRRSKPGVRYEERNIPKRTFPGNIDENGEFVMPDEDYFPSVPIRGWDVPDDGRPHYVDLRTMGLLVDYMRESGIELPKDLKTQMRNEPNKAGRKLWKAMLDIKVDPNTDPKTLVPQTIKNIEKFSGMKYNDMVGQVSESLGEMQKRNNLTLEAIEKE